MAVRSSQTRSTAVTLTWIGLALIVITGLIHAIGIPGNYGDAPYKGLLFVLNALGAGVAAYGIWRGQRWGWMLGLLIAGGAFVMYVISRTLGLPGLPPDTWGEPIGIVSLIAEAGFVIAALTALAQPHQASDQIPAKSPSAVT